VGSYIFSPMDSHQALAFIVAYKISKKQKVKKTECWVRKWVDRRNQLGACSTFVGPFINYIRMILAIFDSLYSM
jgi:hypothetical protein